MKNPTIRKLRCAVYTRKSSEEGLEQEFNSLDAQREACEAYIKSQRHEGWACLAQHYDDGGLSGATMDRPALRQLLADIQAGKTHTVVVLENGFDYDGDRYPSLSKIAARITGTHWSGPRFFGITKTRFRPAVAAEAGRE